MPRHRIFGTSFASIYPHYVAKAERKDHRRRRSTGSSAWLTGYDADGLGAGRSRTTSTWRPSSHRLPRSIRTPRSSRGICGQRVEEIDDPLMQQIRYMDKLVDEVAKGQEDDVDPARQHGRRLTPAARVRCQVAACADSLGVAGAPPRPARGPGRRRSPSASAMYWASAY